MGWRIDLTKPDFILSVGITIWINPKSTKRKESYLSPNRIWVKIRAVTDMLICIAEYTMSTY